MLRLSSMKLILNYLIPKQPFSTYRDRVDPVSELLVVIFQFLSSFIFQTFYCFAEFAIFLNDEGEQLRLLLLEVSQGVQHHLYISRKLFLKYILVRERSEERKEKIAAF